MRQVPHILLGLALTACPANKKPSPDVVLGSVVPLTGPNAAYGVAAKNGIDLAVQHRNDSGGVLSRKIRVVHIDDQGRSADARAATQRLVTQEQVDILIGELTSGPALAMAPIAQRAQIPLITPTATNPQVTEFGDFVFRACFSDPVQADGMAKFAREQLNIDEIAILRDIGSAYSIGLSDAFAKAFSNLGGTIQLQEPYAAEDQSFEQVLKKVAAEARAIYLPGYYPEITRMLKIASDLDPPPVFLGGDGWDTREVVAATKSYPGKTYFSTHFSSADPRTEVKRFVETFTETYNEAPEAYAAQGYDAAMLAFHAVEVADTTNKEKVRLALAEIDGFVGVTGRIRFDAKRNAVKPVVILSAQKGALSFVTSVASEAQRP